MGGTGGIVAFKAMERQEKARQRNMEERRARQIDKVRQRRNGEPRESPVEELVCPSCGLRYDFGDDCLACGTALIGASFHTAAAPMSPPAVRPAALTSGHRYECAQCGESSAERSFEHCGEGEVLDLHRPQDAHYAAALREGRRQKKYTLIAGVGTLSALSGLVLLVVGMVWTSAYLIVPGLLGGVGGMVAAVVPRMMQAMQSRASAQVQPQQAPASTAATATQRPLQTQEARV